MLKAIKIYLNKPLPYVETYAIRFFMSLFFGIFIFVFLWIFQPFAISEYPDTVFIKSLGYGLVTFLIMLFNSFILPPLFPKLFDPNTFKIKHNIYVTVWYLISIAIGNWVYTRYFFYSESSIGLAEFILITLSVGVFPMIIGAYYMEKKLNKAKQKIASEASCHIKNLSTNLINRQYTFSAENSSEYIDLNTEDLFCVKSDGNYCEFYFKEKGIIKKQIIRITLKSIEEKLRNDKDIIQCHRSYIVNLQNVILVSGNARNLSLHFDNLGFTIPISRSNESLVTKAIRHMQ